MPAICDTDKAGPRRPQKKIERSDLVPKFKMAQEITASIRILLHDSDDKAPVLRALEHLQGVTGAKAIAVFQKRLRGNDQIVFDWRYLIDRHKSGGSDVKAHELITFQPASEMVATLAEGLAFRFNLDAAAENEGLIPATGDVNAWLTLPIKVSGAWWGGLCLGGDDTELYQDDIVFPALCTVGDMFGIYFERQIASSENAESDKLAGALEMAGTVCHKLNQPMQVILGYASMVTSGDISEPGQVCEIVKMIESETRRMGIITKNLMGITKYRTVETPEVGLMCDVDNPSIIN